MALLARFGRDKRGNIAVIFGIAVLPILTAVGCAIDYSTATRIKAKLQSAADAASIASISQNSAGYIAAAAMTSNGPVPAGVTEANKIFNGNAATIPGFATLNATPTSTVTKTGPALASTVTFTAQVPVTFMRVVSMIGGGGAWQYMTVTGTSRSSSSLPAYLDFYLTLDVSGSMGLPSTTAEAVRMQSINPDNWVQYRTGCTLACHFAPQNSACKDPPVTPPAAPPANPATTITSYTQQYNTNNYCMGYVYSRLGQTALANLINQASTPSVPKQKPGLPTAMLAGLNTSVSPGSPNSLITGNTSSLPYSIPAAQSCPTAGTDSCIQLRLDAVGFALNATQAANGVSGLFETAQKKEAVTNQFRIGLYPFIQKVNTNYSPLTTSISSGSAISNDASNLAALLDTNMNANLGSGGTHIDTALNTMNTVIPNGGDGSSSISTMPYVFLVTDGAQDNQTKGVPNGGWAGSNHATVIDPIGTNVCSQLKTRGIKIAVLYIPYQTISPVNTAFAGDEDDYANNNIPNIPASLQGCASPPDAAGSYFYTANSPSDITDALKAMFNHAVMTAHITN
jgi:Flp pilus assembly protein TadG